MRVLPLAKTAKQKLAKYGLEKKFAKQLETLKKDPRHPSLHTELLEPKKYGIYSFRLDNKFRALFVYHKNIPAIEILAITKHYE